MFKPFFTLTLTTLTILTSSFSHFIFADTSKGETLEKEMWADMKAHKWGEVEKRIAPYFQSIHSDGARNRTQEMTLIKNLELGDYTLKNVKVTEDASKGTIVISYEIATDETIDAERLSTKPSPRLSVWQKDSSGNWLWVSHANLNPIK